jgi:outer membrane lipoprotein-sorting protein
VNRQIGALITLGCIAFALRAPAWAGLGALDDASAAWAKVDDYRMTMTVHEVASARTEDRTLSILFKKPALEHMEIVSGADRGSGVVWQGGDTVKAHKGGFLSGLHATFNLHDKQVETLRGGSVDTATIPGILAQFTPAKGTLTEAPGPQIDGVDTTAVTLVVANPAPGEVTRDVLFLSAATHLPIRREGYAGTDLVRSFTVTDFKPNVGLTSSDFPW